MILFHKKETMQKETTYRNHYKTNPRLKNTIIFFHILWFYKTYESDAILLSQLFWFKLTIQDWFNSIWFSDSSQNYLDRLENADYWFVVLELQKDWNISVLRQNEWTKSLDINISSDTFQWLLDDILHIHKKYDSILNINQPNKWTKLIDTEVSFGTFQWLLDDILRIHDKYNTTLRLIQPFDLPFLNNTQKEKYQIKDIYFKKKNDDNTIEKSETDNKQTEAVLL